MGQKKLKIWPFFIINFIIKRHPEVPFGDYIYFLYLYAEIVNFFGQSAGNGLPQDIALGCLLGANSSETLRSDFSEKLLQNFPKNNKDWGSYLAGLIEGDGHFSSDKRIKITFSESDYNLAVLLQKIFSCGRIYKIKDKKAFDWIINKKSDVVRLLNLINGSLRTEYKLAQIHKNMIGLIDSNYQQKPDISNLLESWWLAGFTEAEGCFYVHILDPRKHRSSIEIRAHYKFGLKDNTILNQLREIFGSSVYKRTHSYDSKRGEYIEKKITYYWSSTSFKAAQKVVLYFENRHLLGSKRDSFEKWRFILLLVLSKQYKNPEVLETIKQLKKTMNTFSNASLDIACF
nr:hypothetical protein [Oedogonium sp. 244]